MYSTGSTLLNYSQESSNKNSIKGLDINKSSNLNMIYGNVKEGMIDSTGSTTLNYTQSSDDAFKNSIKGLDINKPSDWNTIWSKVKEYKQPMTFANFRGNIKALSSSYAGCVGTDEDGKSLITPNAGLCDPKNFSNENPCKIDNLHTPDTCKLNAGIFDAQKNFEILSRKAKTYSPGLNFNVFNGTMRDNYDNFFSSNPQNLFGGVSTEFSNLGAQTHNIIIENVGTGHSWLGNGTNTHYFTIEWTGFFKPPQKGTYTFSMESDDSSILWIDEGANNPSFYGTKRNVFLDNAGGHGMLIKTNSYTVNDSNYHPIRIRFEEGWGGYGFIFKILDNNGKDVTNESLFNAYSDMFTFYSLIRNNQRPDLYDCYITGSNYNIEKTCKLETLYYIFGKFTIRRIK
jgi:hypothetical protein